MHYSFRVLLTNQKKKEKENTFAQLCKRKLAKIVQRVLHLQERGRVCFHKENKSIQFHGIISRHKPQ